MKFFIPGPTLRIASGLVGLCLTLVMAADFLFGVFPNRQSLADAQRARIAETSTALLAEPLRAQDALRARAMLEAVRARNPDMLSAGVRQADGHLVVSTGPHAADWAEATGTNAQSTRVLVPIQASHGVWGRAEFAFEPAVPTTAAGWLADQRVWLALGLPALCLLLVYAYLKRVLLHLNPMATVPERLRDAFDGLTEGVALLDVKGRVVLANSGLRELAGVDAQKLHGRDLQAAAQLELAELRKLTPWELVLKGGDAARGVRVYVGQGDKRKVGMLNCSPITDPNGHVRGCMVTIDDVTEVERSNQGLRVALDELSASRAKIEAQNVELVKLATCDGLTGLLNRRAFFEKGGAVIQRLTAQRSGRLAVVMMDVDHFKRFNDTYGHATGDVVLKRVADCMTRSMRPQDVVARYGGEEFCMLIEDVDSSTAVSLADRLRRTIASDAGQLLYEGQDVPITASLGVCWRSVPPGPLDLSDMLRLADEALYEAKRGGRNAVRLAAVAAASDGVPELTELA